MPRTVRGVPVFALGLQRGAPREGREKAGSSAPSAECVFFLESGVVFAENPRAYFVMRPLVLCVDDDANVLASLARSLQCDFTVRTAQSGAVALSLLNDGAEYAAILADMKMPCMDGLEFLAKASVLAPDTVAAMLTGDGDQDTAVNALNAGTVQRFIKKPAPIELIKETLHACCKLHEKLRSGQSGNEHARNRGGLPVGQKQDLWIERIPVRKGDRTVFIEAENIHWIEAASNYVLIHAEGMREIVRETLGAFERKLCPQHFARISRSAIVRLGAIQETRTNGLREQIAVLKTGAELVVTRSVKQLRQKMELNAPDSAVRGVKKERKSAQFTQIL